jgi:flavin-dependent dehydrogenase
MPEVTIIGGGPAASVAALLLARDGWRVTLLEQHRFPRDKVCGECLSAMGIDVLRRIGLRDPVESLGPVRLRRAFFTGADGPGVTLDLPREMWGLPRSVMDDCLLRAARDAGANVLQPWRCEQVVGGICPVVRARDLETNVVREFSPHYVILADGKGAPGKERPDPTSDFGFKAHFEHVDAPRDVIMLFGACGHYVGVAAVTPQRWNVALSVPQVRLRMCDGDGDRVLNLMRQENTTLATAMSRAERSTDWLAAPLPRFGPARRWPRRVIPIGNAAAALEPIGGEGMGLAMRSAELAAEALIKGSREQIEFDAAGLRRQYARLWNVRRFASRASAMAVSRPMLAQAIVPLAESSRLGQLAMSWMGK